MGFLKSFLRENKLDEFISVEGFRTLDNTFCFRPSFVVEFEEPANSNVSLSSKSVLDEVG